MALVAIVGRPNVGKSTLFNRLVEQRQAIVHDEPGVTRDRVYGRSEWNGVFFSVVDTGGFVPHSADVLEAAIREQVNIAVAEADLILFVVDVQVGITDLDAEIADMLRTSGKSVSIVANKADNETRRWEASAFYQLGLGEVHAVSSVNGMGTGDLLDEVVASLPPEEPIKNADHTRIAFIGKPNVGKSSLTNALLGYDRSIVTDISGTTRDSIDSLISFNERNVILVDTAGLRRKARVRENVEFYSALRTERAIQTCEVAVVILDAEQGLEAQDIKVLKQAEENMKGLVLAINKWDLLDKATNTARDYERSIKERLQTLAYVPVIFVSALTRQRVDKLLQTALTVADERAKRISTSKLNSFLEETLAQHTPPLHRGNRVKIYYATQIRTAPPVIAFFCNQPSGITESYRRYLENRLRETFGFQGVPLKLAFRAR